MFVLPLLELEVELELEVDLNVTLNVQDPVVPEAFWACSVYVVGLEALGSLNARLLMSVPLVFVMPSLRILNTEMSEKHLMKASDRVNASSLLSLGIVTERNVFTVFAPRVLEQFSLFSSRNIHLLPTK